MIKKLMEYLRTDLLRQRNLLIRNQKKLPAGMLVIERNGRHYKWNQIIKEKNRRISKKYIPKSNQDLAVQLARKNYLSGQISLISAQIAAAERFLNEYPSSGKADSYASRADSCAGNPEYERLLALSGVPDMSKLKTWAAVPYPRLSDHPERLNVPTKAGIMVRSKSEALIADTLFDLGIPFRYEEELDLGDMKVYPDFSFYLAGRKVYWEHMGLMDNQAYASKAKTKLDYYFDQGFLPGWNLILTFENKDHPLNSRHVLIQLADLLM